MRTITLCKDCKWRRYSLLPAHLQGCKADRAVSAVSGRVIWTGKHEFASLNREDVNLCGPTAKWFQPSWLARVKLAVRRRMG